jgi:prepilin-type processing-associated H-X9-DG protein
MNVMLPLAMIMTALEMQEPSGAGKGGRVLPFLGEEVAIVVRADLTKIDPRAIVARVGGKVAETEEIEGPTKLVNGWVEAMKAAGAKELYVLIDLTDMPGFPVAVVPLEPGADAAAITAVFATGAGGPVRWPVVETMRGAVVAGRADAIERLRAGAPPARLEVGPALAACADAPISLAIIPSKTQRRALEESITVLPPQLGGGDIKGLTQGMEWASFSAVLEPSASLHAVFEAKNAEGMSAIRALIEHGMATLKQEGERNPAIKPLISAVSDATPVVNGNRITLSADLLDATKLLAMPLQQAREASRRAQCVNNLKQIMLAMHNFHATNNAFPSAYTQSADGKPLLSWRVQILPYVEQSSLYNQFHLNEAWDSPHNKALIAKMPVLYACPSARAGLFREGKTTYLAPRGPKTILRGAVGVKIQEITDGTSNTVAVVEVADDAAVIWTKPDDWEVPAELDPKSLVAHHPRGFNAAFADGSVRFIMGTVVPDVLKALMTANGGEVISSDSY